MRHFFHSLTGPVKDHIDPLSLKQLDCLQQKVVVGISEDLDEVLAGQGLHLGLDGHPTLQLDSQLSRFHLLEGTRTHKQDVARVYLHLYGECVSVLYLLVLTVMVVPSKMGSRSY